jgi:uncharacterized protein (TIGR02996 family)
MTEQEALLAAIRDNPDDDTPRLVYADWLDEHATTEPERARAEFIRVQCALGQLKPQDPEYAVLDAHAKTLASQFSGEWLSPLPKQISDNTRFWRGFPEEFVPWLASALAESGFMWAREPVLVVGVHGDVAMLTAALPALRGAAGLTIYQSEVSTSDADELVTLIAEDAGFASLRTFSLEEVTDIGAESIANSPHLRLRMLRLSDNHLTAKGWRLLVNARALDGIDALALDRKRSCHEPIPRDEALCALSASPHLHRLRCLTIARVEATSIGAAALNASPYMSRLEMLDLAEPNWTAIELAALLAGNAFPALERLYLRSNRFGPEAMHVLASSPVTSRLTELDLANNPIGSAGISALLTAPDLAHLRCLRLYNNAYGDEGIPLLADSRKLTGLRELSIGNSRFEEIESGKRMTDVSIDSLLTATWLDQLETLILDADFSPQAKQRLTDRLGPRVKVR